MGRWFSLLLGLAGCTDRTMAWGEPPESDPAAPADRTEVAANVNILGIGCQDPAGAGPFLRKHSNSPPSLDRNWLWGGGVIAGDLLSDTLHDLVAPAEPYAKAYRGQDNEEFPEDSCLDPFDLDFGTGGSVVDYDDDGLLDLLITRFEKQSRLLRNKGDLTFEDVTERVGLVADGPALASTWADFDRDGDLDLFVGNYASVRDFQALEDSVAVGSRLFVNEGGVSFTDRTDLLPAEIAGAWVTAAAWVDLDLDQWPDLYVASDLGDFTGNVLVMNQAGRLVGDDNLHGLDHAMPARGMAIGDLDGDGLPDFVIGERNHLRVLISQVGMTRWWNDESQELGVTLAGDQIDPWGIDLGDLDNDGRLDIVASFGTTHPDDPDTGADQPDGAWMRGPGGQFRDRALALGLADRGVNRGVVLADLDNDGSLDVAKRDLEGPNLLYVSQCDPAAGWLRVQLSQLEGNHFAVGARVEVHTGDGVQTRTITAGGIGFGSGGPPEAHFGIGTNAFVDRLVVTWPDGKTTTRTDVPAASIVRIDRIE